MKDLNLLLCQLDNIINMGWVPSTAGGSGGIGITVERLLNRESNSLPIADFGEIEIKTRKLYTRSYITLFSAAPDSYLFETKRLYEKYGYPHSKAPQFKAFNISVYSNYMVSLSRRYDFIIRVDRSNEKIVLQVYNKRGHLVDDMSSWSFDLLRERILLKLKHLLLVKADRKFEIGTVYYKYLYARLYILKDFDSFITAIEKGKIRITFKLNVILTGPKMGQMHDHGTSFDIREEDLKEIYYLI